MLQENPMVGPPAITLDLMGAKNTPRIVFQFQVCEPAARRCRSSIR
jgi:hypothetical protein